MELSNMSKEEAQEKYTLLQNMMNTAGWAVFKAEIDGNREFRLKALIKDKELEKIYRHQGYLNALEFLQDLPKRLYRTGWPDSESGQQNNGA